MYTPLEQFTVSIYSKIFNTTSLYLIMTFTLLMLIMNIFSNRKSYLVIYNYNILYFIINLFILIYNQFYSVLTRLVNSYLPFITCLFFFILIHNVIGLIPYSFTITSQFIITAFLSTSIIIGVTLIGIIYHKGGFIHLFIPQGVSPLLLPLITLIEIISYLSRIISLSVRLSANMISGHILLAIICSFSISSGLMNCIFIFIPILLIFLFLEFGVAFIQAFVFSVLSATYIKDSVLLH